jgi:hypothetical protein
VSRVIAPIAAKPARFYAIWTAVSSASGLVLSLSSAEIAERIGVSPQISLIMLIIGLMLVLLGLVAMILCSMVLISQARLIRATSAELSRLLKRIDYETRPASRADLGALREYVIRYFGTGVSPLQLMLGWMDRNPAVMHIICPNGQSKIVGAFVILPLFKRAERHLQSEFIDGTGILPEYVARDPRRAACFYVGSIIGDSMYIRALAMQAVRNELARLAVGKKVYARPVSKDGMRICRKWGFVPVLTSIVGDPLGHIHYLDFRADIGQSGTRPL